MHVPQQTASALKPLRHSIYPPNQNAPFALLSTHAHVCAACLVSFRSRHSSHAATLSFPSWRSVCLTPRAPLPASTFHFYFPPLFLARSYFPVQPRPLPFTEDGESWGRLGRHFVPRASGSRAQGRLVHLGAARGIFAREENGR